MSDPVVEERLSDAEQIRRLIEETAARLDRTEILVAQVRDIDASERERADKAETELAELRAKPPPESVIREVLRTIEVPREVIVEKRVEVPVVVREPHPESTDSALRAREARHERDLADALARPAAEPVVQRVEIQVPVEVVREVARDVPRDVVREVVRTIEVPVDRVVVVDRIVEKQVVRVVEDENLRIHADALERENAWLRHPSTSSDPESEAMAENARLREDALSLEQARLDNPDLF